jgi:hypothetical protein
MLDKVPAVYTALAGLMNVVCVIISVKGLARNCFVCNARRRVVP